MGQLDRGDHYTKVEYSSDDREKAKKELGKAIVSRLLSHKKANPVLLYDVKVHDEYHQIVIDFIPDVRDKLLPGVLQKMVSQPEVEYFLRLKEKYISLTGSRSRSPITKIYYDRIDKKAKRAADKIWEEINFRINGDPSRDAKEALEAQEALFAECKKYNLDTAHVSWDTDYAEGIDPKDEEKKRRIRKHALIATFHFSERTWQFTQGIRLRYNPFAKQIDHREAKFNAVEAGLIEGVLDSLEMDPASKSAIQQLMNNSSRFSFSDEKIALSQPGSSREKWDVSLDTLSNREFEEIIPILTAMSL